MIARFCLYGFLKNQRYFEPFIVLAFLDKGLSFFAIGVLVAVREITVNLTEVVSGAVADVYGRRASMVASFVAYIASFVTLGMASTLPLLVLGMALYGCADAFRTGTHKAMIFTWLRIQGRSDERTAVYGYTRSWSKIGSAVSVVIATALVFALDRYEPVFFLAIAPYVLNIFNLATYPAALDARTSEPASISAVLGRLRSAVRQAIAPGPLRRLLGESMGYEGTFTVAKEYLQPALKGAVLGLSALAFTAGLGDAQRVALLVGPVYFVLFVASAWASRRAKVVVERLGDESRAARILWVIFATCFGLLLVAAVAGWTAVVIAIFVALYIVQNVWRPILIARIDEHCADEEQATILSVEHQVKSLAAAILAPAVGYAVDTTGMLWPVGAVGVMVAAIWFVTTRSISRYR